MAILAMGEITKMGASGATFYWGPSIGVSAAHWGIPPIVWSLVTLLISHTFVDCSHRLPHVDQWARRTFEVHTTQ